MEESLPLPPIDPDFEPQSRPRSCTWPLPRPDISAVKQEAPDGGEPAAGTPPGEDEGKRLQRAAAEQEKAAGPGAPVSEPGAPGGVTPRKGSSRRNAWGNQSYADLISQAIENSPEKRLTLAQIYEWMVKTVPYFRDKGDSNSSAGWKNSIRHNLSLHNKFLRVHNESTGKSSWWMLNPEGGKTGKAPRRRAASMDNGGKLLKSRMRAKQTKKQAEGAGTGADSPNSSQQFPKWGVSSGSPSPRGGVPDDSDMWTSFRPRTSSNASTLSGRLSPIAPGQEEDEGQADDGLLGRYAGGALTPALAESLMEELDLIDGLTLMGGRRGGPVPPPPPTPLPSAATLLPRASFSPPDAGPAFGNSLFGSTPYGARTASGLEALLTSDSPPPSDMLMAAGLGPDAPRLLLAKAPEVTAVAQRNLRPPTQPRPHLPLQHHASPGLGAILSGIAPLQAANPFGGPHCFHAVPERLPTDLDVDMFTENLDCDVDYIINSDLMDGDAIDFNFDPVLPAGQSYAGPATAQGSARNWVPS
ncbi:forkhead box protein O4 [Stigmatopora argus]